MVYDNNLIQSGARPNLFESFSPTFKEAEPKYEDIEAGLFQEDENDNLEEKISAKSPKIRVLTPVRKKNVDFKDIFQGADFKKMFPIPHIKDPTPDYSDEDEVNERVRKLINNSNNVEYGGEDDRVKEAALEAFEIKYKSIAGKYPDYSVKFNREKSLNSIHKNYHSVVRSIYAHMNVGQTQMGYILILLVWEVVCIKIFNLPMAGFTKMEMKRMFKYNALMIEIGEDMYTSGGEGEVQDIKWRIGTAFLWNIVKILSSYMGGDSMIDTIRTIVDKLFENNINIDNIESGEAKKINEEENDLFSGLFDGGSDGTSELAEFISSLGSSFTQGMENSRKGPRPKNKSRVIFDD
jgi:hypothetical protein